MDSDLRNTRPPIPVPRTGVPLGITDPVEKARAELKAALAAQYSSTTPGTVQPTETMRDVEWLSTVLWDHE